MRTAGFHQANMISETLDTVRHEVLAEVQQVQHVVANAIAGVPPIPEQNHTLPQIQTANTVIANSNPEMTGLLTMITNLTTTVQSSRCQKSHSMIFTFNIHQIEVS